MKYNPDKHHRRSIRIPGYDYSQSGCYFVTICTNLHELLFGDVVDGQMVLNEYGEIVKKYWTVTPEHFPHVNLDEYMIMPNHVHGVLVINDQYVGAKNFSPLHKSNTTKFQPPSKSIGSVIRGFKIGVTKWFRKNTDVYIIWQRNYGASHAFRHYEHVIRDDYDLKRIREYIINNPVKWLDDKYFI